MLSATALAKQQIDPFIADGGIREIKISPTGQYLAMSVRVDGQTGLLVRNVSDGKTTAVMRFTRDTHVNNFWWVNDQRLIMSLSETFGTRDDPLPTGELYGMNADGGRKQILAGFRAITAHTGTRLGGKKEDAVAAFMVDTLAEDPDNVLVAIRPYGTDAHTHLARLNVYDGRSSRVTSIPVQGADFISDNQGRVRLGTGSLSDNYSQLFYRTDDASPWEQINHERTSGRVEIPLGFAADNFTAYLRVSQSSGPYKIMALDTRTGERKEVAADSAVDPVAIYDPAGRRPIGAWYLGGRPKVVYFDEQGPDAKLQQMLQRAFPDGVVSVRSSSRDGRLRVVLVGSDIDPGTFYLFDTQAKNADMIAARDEQIDPGAMSPMKSIQLKSRDGLQLHGFITLPAGSSGKSLPMVVVPHGGPFGVFDQWDFNKEVQLLASAGYAVLQVNFRGSGNYGRAFKQAGARQWGGTMQDDLTDATRWAIEQGYTNAGRVCIFGASYGAYAALMGAVKEPALYQCAAGYVGVYDLPRMQRQDSSEARWRATWAREWVGDDMTALASASPVNRASEIKVPVFLAAGGKDEVAPIEHTKRMESALKRASVPVETLYYPNEGHGFYEAAHRREFYSKLLQFLGQHIGPGKD